MTRGAARFALRLAPCLLLLTLFGQPCSVRAETRLPLALEDVATGQVTELAVGAAALHLVFFAPWCPPCVEELKQLAALEDRWSERGYRLVLIAVHSRTTRERLLRFSEQHRPPGRMYLDASGEVQRSFEVDELPTHFLIDASGREVGRWPGMDDELEDAARALLLSPNGGS